jgi:hypothetical protein
MTDEEIEKRLQLLQTPLPPDRLRKRCLEVLAESKERRGAAGERRNPTMALVASFLVFALVAWLVMNIDPAGRPSVRPQAPAELHLPAFTFRTMDHQAVKVFVNGMELSQTPCLWSITELIEFDPKIQVDEWPPQGARFAGSTQDREIPAHKAEIYIGEGKPLVAKLPHIKPDESIVYVNASIGGRKLQGALRLRLEGYHYIDYTPLVDPEGEEARRLLRSIWFEKS